MNPRTLPTPGRPDQVDGTMTWPQMVRALAALWRLRRDPTGIEDAVRNRALEAVELARRMVPFYSDLYSDLYGDRVVSDLSELPVIDKAMMRSVPPTDLLAAPLPPGCVTQRTSGTTGVPFEAFYSPRYARWQGLLKLRTHFERDMPPWTKRAQLVFGSGDTRAKPLALRLAERRHLALPLDGDTEELADRIAQWRPHSLGGHPSRLLDVGLLLPDRAKPAVLTTVGETLEPAVRARLEAVFGRPPLDSYGTSEVGAVARQCALADLYHVQVETLVVEVLDDDRRPVAPGGTGNIVLTGLHNPLMPMIRYQVHDRVTLADRPCRCGFRGQCLTSIIGRSSDFAVGAAGERISPERLWLYNHLDQDLVYRHVRRYQVHQQPDGEIVVRLELQAPLPTAIEEALVRSYRQTSAGQIVTIRIEDDLGEREPGKFRLVRSDAPRPG